MNTKAFGILAGIAFFILPVLAGIFTIVYLLAENFWRILNSL